MADPQRPTEAPTSVPETTVKAQPGSPKVEANSSVKVSSTSEPNASPPTKSKATGWLRPQTKKSPTPGQVSPSSFGSSSGGKSAVSSSTPSLFQGLTSSRRNGLGLGVTRTKSSLNMTAVTDAENSKKEDPAVLATYRGSPLANSEKIPLTGSVRITSKSSMPNLLGSSGGSSSKSGSVPSVGSLFSNTQNSSDKTQTTPLVQNNSGGSSQTPVKENSQILPNSSPPSTSSTSSTSSNTITPSSSNSSNSSTSSTSSTSSNSSTSSASSTSSNSSNSSTSSTSMGKLTSLPELTSVLKRDIQKTIDASNFEFVTLSKQKSDQISAKNSANSQNSQNSPLLTSTPSSMNLQASSQAQPQKQIVCDTIHKAAFYGNVDAAKGFLKFGVNDALKVTKVPEREYSGNALHFACDAGNYEVVALLLQHGVNLEEYTTDYHMEALKSDPELRKNLQKAAGDSHLYEEHLRDSKLDGGDRTALHLAIQNGHARIVRMLISQRKELVTMKTTWFFQITGKGKEDKSCLHLAADRYEFCLSFLIGKSCHVKIARILLEHLTPDKFQEGDRFSEIPVLAVCRNGDVDMTRLFVDHSMKIDLIYTDPMELIQGFNQMGFMGDNIEDDPMADFGGGGNPNAAGTKKVSRPPIAYVTDIELISVLVNNGGTTNKTKLPRDISPRMEAVKKVVDHLTGELKKIVPKGGPISPQTERVMQILRDFVEDPKDFDFHTLGKDNKDKDKEKDNTDPADYWTLSLRHLSLRSLPPEISLLNHLTTLKLDSNRFTSIPEAVFDLTGLTRLSLRHNQIRDVPYSLTKLTSLMKFSLHNNQITKFPSEVLLHLTKLIHLTVSLNRLSTFPPEIGELKTLQLLELGNNRLESIPSEIGKLTNLTYLSLYGNKLKTVPDSLGFLVNASAVILDNNSLQSLPTTFVSYPNPNVVTIANNLEGQIFTLSEYLFDYSEGGKPCSKLKLIVLGNGGVGKTTLLNGLKKKNVSVLKKNKVSLQTRSTVGIDIDAQKLKLHNSISFQVWDFAGQIEYSTTHQYFLSQSRVIYLIVVSLTREIRSQIDYWISYVSTKVDFSTPLTKSYRFLLVGSKADQLNPEETKKMEQEFKTIISESSHIFDDFQFISSLSLEGLGNLQKKIINNAKELLDASKDSKRIPRLYLNILKEIKSKSESIVTTDFNVNDAKTMRAVSFLHDIGDVIYHKPSGSICTDPQTLAKVMALFVCPEEHSNTLLGYINQEYQNTTSSILSQQQVVLKLRMLAKSIGIDINDKSAQLIVKAMEQFGFCIRLSKEEEKQYGQSGVLFPALRPAGQFQWIAFDFPTWTLGVRITDVKSKHNPNKEYHAKSVIMYANGIQVNLSGKSAQFLLQPSSKYVDILVRGDAIRDFWRRIQEALASVREDLNGTSFQIDYLDPFSLFKDVKTFPLDMTEVKLMDSSVNPSYMEFGVKSDVTFRVRYPWEFVAGIENVPSDWSVETGKNCYQLVLEPPPAGMEWQNKSYQAEFEAVRQAFNFFVGNDVAETFKLDKVVVLNNKVLQSKFEDVYAKFRSRPPNSKPWQDSDPEKREWREWIMSNLSKYVKNISGDEMTNLVLGWHGGATEDVCKIIGESNFRIMGKTDAGYFGAGIYFTQYPSYGDLYVQEKIRKIAIEKQTSQPRSPDSKNRNTGDRGKNRGDREDTKESEKSSSHRQFPLLLSWILLGNVYPVTENPQGNPEKSLFGKPCVPGYDSHYVLVKKVGNLNYFPCAHDSPVGPDYDELVVFSPDQILPRYLIYYSSVENSRENARTILWVDANHAVHAGFIKQLQSEGISLKLLSKTQELKDWFQRNGLKLNKKEKKELRIISSRYRPGDGDETAGERLCQWLKDPKSQWCGTPFLLFSDDINAVNFQSDAKRKIWVTHSIEVVHSFVVDDDLKEMPEVS